MAKGVARYQVLFGVTGCMPNSNEVHEFRTRRDLLAFINEELDRLEWPRSLLNKETRGIREIWRFIAKRGSSSAHFSMHHKGHALEFCGVTDDEFTELCRQDEFA